MGQRDFKSGQKSQIGAIGISNRGRNYKSGQGLQFGAEQVQEELSINRTTPFSLHPVKVDLRIIENCCVGLVNVYQMNIPKNAISLWRVKTRTDPYMFSPIYPNPSHKYRADFSKLSSPRLLRSSHALSKRTDCMEQAFNRSRNIIRKF